MPSDNPSQQPTTARTSAGPIPSAPTADDSHLTGPYHPLQEATTPSGGPPPDVPGYEILGKLGEGGMGVVYKARHLALKRLVALKMIRLGRSGADDQARFRAEAEAIARLDHPHIVQIHDVGTFDDQPYYALEFVEGGSLDRRLRGEVLPPRQAAALAQTLARAMHYAHQRGVVHRDLKPANVLLQTTEHTENTDKRQSGEGQGAGQASSSAGLSSSVFSVCSVVKITDFGLVRFLDEQATGQTRTGAIVGTPSYMSPEQALGHNSAIGPATDVYALGAILYELLTGRPPFKSPTVLETLEQVRTREPVPVRQVQPRCPRDLETICLKCLRKEPGRRYASAEELADDLQRFLTGVPITARPVGALERALKWTWRRPAEAALVVVIALFVLGVLAAGYAYLGLEARRAADLEGKNLELTHERDRAREQTEIARRAQLDADLKTQEALQQKKRAEEATERERHNLLNFQYGRIAPLWQQDPGQALTLLQDLKACPLDLRDFTWHLYYQLCKRDRVHIAAAGRGGFFSPVAVSGDGRTAALVGYQAADREPTATVRVFDLTTGQERGRILGPPGKQVGTLALGHDGRTLAAAFATRLQAGTDNAITLWDVGTGLEQAVLQGPQGEVTVLAFAPDGKRLASGDRKGLIQLWELPTGKAATACTGHKGAITTLTFPGTADSFVSGSEDRTVKVWQTSTGTEKRSFPWHDRTLGCAGRFLALPGQNEIEVRDLTASDKPTTLKTEWFLHTAVAISPDGRYVAAAGLPVHDGRVQFAVPIKVWERATGRLHLTLSLRGTQHANLLAFSPDGSSLFTGSQLGDLTVWRVEVAPERPALPGSGDLVWGPGGELVGTLQNRDTGWSLIQAGTGLELRRFPNRFQATAIGARGRFLALAGWKPGERPLGPVVEQKLANEVRLWDLVTGVELKPLAGHPSPIKALAFSADGKVLASACNREVKVWDSASGREIRLFSSPEPLARSLALSPDGQTLATTESESVRFARGVTTVVVWDVAGGHETRRLHFRGQVHCLAFAPDGRLLAAGGRDEGRAGAEVGGRVKVWDVGATPTSPGTAEARAEDSEKVDLDGLAGLVLSLAFTPDGKGLATCSVLPAAAGRTEGTELKLWDLVTAQERFALADPGGGGAGAVAFTPDGKGLAWRNGKEWRLWERYDGADRGILLPHEGKVTALAVLPGSANGPAVLSAAESVSVWDGRTARRRLLLAGTRFVCSADGAVVATSGGKVGDRAVKVWETATGAERGRVALVNPAGLLALSPSIGHTDTGKRLLATAETHPVPRPGDKEKPPMRVTQTRESRLQLWDAQTGKLEALLPLPAEDVQALQFTPDGTRLLLGGSDSKVRVWDVAGKRLADPLPGRHRLLPSPSQPETGGLTPRRSQAVVLWDADSKVFQRWGPGTGFTPISQPVALWLTTQLSPDGKILAVAETEGVRLFDTATGRERALLRQERPTSLTFAPDSQLLAGVNLTGDLKLWDLSGKEYSLGNLPVAGPLVVFSPDGRSLLSAGGDATVRVWDATARRPLAASVEEADELRVAAFSRDGAVLAAGSWDPVVKVRQVATGSLVRSLEGHTGTVLTVAISPDGQTLASAGQDRTIRLWDLASLAVTPALRFDRATLAGHQDTVTSLAFAADGKTLVSGSKDRTVRVWDLDRGAERWRLEGHQAAVLCVALAEDGRTLASAGADRTVKIWDVTTGKERARNATEGVPYGHPGAVWSLAFDPDVGRAGAGGRRLAGGGRDGTVLVWDLATGKVVHTLRTAPVTALAFGAGGELACGSADGTVVLWEPALDRQRSLKHPRAVNGLQFRPGESALAVASIDGTLSLWDTATGRPRFFRSSAVVTRASTPDGSLQATVGVDGTVTVRGMAAQGVLSTLRGHLHRVGALALSADGRTLATGSDDTTIKVWDTATGQERLTLRGHALGISRLQFTADGRTLASGSYDTTIKLWDLATGQESATLRGLGVVHTLSLSRDGNLLLAGSQDGSAALWDTRTRAVRQRFPAFRLSLAALALSPDGKKAALAGDTDQGRLFDAGSGAELGAFKGFVTSLLFSPDGKLLIAGGTLTKAWDAETLQEVMTFRNLYGSPLTVRPDGKTLLVQSGYDGSGVTHWDLTTGKECTPFKGHTSMMASLALSPDGKTLASAGGNDERFGELKVWDMESGRERFPIANWPQLVFSVAISPDGKTLAAGGLDGTIRLWDLATGKELPGPPKVIGGINSVAFTPDGTTLVAGRRWYLFAVQKWALRDVQLWDLKAGKERAVLTGLNSGPMKVAVSPDGRLVAAGSIGGEVKVWEMPGGKEVYSCAHNDRLNALVFSPDGKLLASGSIEPKGSNQYVGIVKIWDARTGKERLTLTGFATAAMALAFSPDSKTLAVGSYDGMLRLWDADSGKERAAVSISRGVPNAMLYTRDGKRLITADNERKIQFWDVAWLERQHAVGRKP